MSKTPFALLAMLAAMLAQAHQLGQQVLNQYESIPAVVDPDGVVLR